MFLEFNKLCPRAFFEAMDPQWHGLIKYIDTKAKCRHRKKGTLRQMFIKLCVCGGRGWGSGPQTDKHLPQSPFTGQFF
jgi:hypothetical protein